VSKDTFGALLAAWLAQIDLPSLGSEGPDDLDALLRASFLLIPLGLIVGIAGHLTGLKSIVATGIGLVMLGTVVFIVAIAGYG
jgi:hypothetical protein